MTTDKSQPSSNRSSPPALVTVESGQALKWVRGNLDDGHLLAMAILAPEVVFIVNLPDRKAYFAACFYMIKARQSGAVAVITRTRNQIVSRHLVKLGAIVGHTEPDGAQRLLLPPAGFAKWGQRLGEARIQ